MGRQNVDPVFFFVCLFVSIGSSSINDGNGNDYAINLIKNLIGRVRKNKRAARAARTHA